MEKKTRQDDIAVLLANRAYLYRLFQNIFGNEPTSESINILKGDHTEEAFSLLSLEKDLAISQVFYNNFDSNEEEALDRVVSEYTRLFIGPSKLPAPPWESVYLSTDRTLFQESTLRVRQCYLKYNYLPANYRSEADDHIALELDFMANLSILAEKALETGNILDTKQILEDQQAFLQDHLLNWVPQFIEDLKMATTHPLYLGMALILGKFLTTDLTVIGEILTVLES